MWNALRRSVALWGVLALSGCAEPATLSNVHPWFTQYVLDAAKQGNACAEQAVELDQVIEAHRRCASNADCVSPYVGVCPFACYTALNRSGAPELVGQLKQFETSCHMCDYECRESNFEAVCRANRCELGKRL